MASDDTDVRMKVDRRPAQHRREWELFQLLEHVPVGVFVADGAGKPYYANAQARGLLGMAKVPDHVDRFSEVYQAFEIGTDRPYPGERLPLIRALAGERSEISDIEVRGRGSSIPLHVSGAPIKHRGEIAFAVMALQDVRELRRIATQDALTGLPNRMALTEAFPREQHRAARGRYSNALALLDFDRFKAINDTFGHAAGDAVLRSSAAAIVGALLPTDIVGRWGGDELLVLLPDADLEDAHHEIEQALAAVRRLESPIAATELQVSFSAGVVEAIRGETLEDAVRRADAALYQAKHAGRDRVVTSKATASE